MSAARAVRAHLGSVAASSEDPDSRLAKAVGEGPAHFDLPASIQHAEQTEAAVASAVGPVSLASVAVALLVIIAASGTWLERRRVELRVLAIRGALAGSVGGQGDARAVGADAGRSRRGPDGGSVDGALVRAERGGRTPGVARLQPSPPSSPPCSAWPSGPSWWPHGCATSTSVRVFSGKKSDYPSGSWSSWHWPSPPFYELHTARRRDRRIGKGGPRVDGLVLLFPVLLLAGKAGLIVRFMLSKRLLD